MFHSWLTIPFFFLLSSSYTNAFTWKFTSQPSQCQNVSVAVQGLGQPPYSIVIIPVVGPSSLVPGVQNIPFPGSNTSLSFQLNYPANSSFIAVVCLYPPPHLLELLAYCLPHCSQVSDSSGFGTGGTSTPVTVLGSSDSSCYDPTPLSFFFFLNASNITQCETLRWYWQQNSVNGCVLHSSALGLSLRSQSLTLCRTVKFYGVIPGGNSFDIQGPLSTDNAGTGFDWIADVRAGTVIYIVGGDDRGLGSGGAPSYTVAYSANSSCLNSTSPSSTAGSPAGGTYPTSYPSNGPSRQSS